MNTILVSSTTPYSGKSGVCIALVRELEARGRDVGYFKPYGTMPMPVDGITTDQDAAYINRLLAKPGPVEKVCPVVRTVAFVEEVLSGRATALPDRVRQAFADVSEGRDVMVVEGPSDVAQGRAAGLALCELAEVLDARALLVERAAGLALPDALMYECDCLRGRLGGVVYNWVTESDRPAVRDHIAPFLQRNDIPFFGTIAADPVLSSVTVGEIVEALHGTVLSSQDRMDLDVENFMVGAMGLDMALHLFRRKARKAVITGGDRSDVQLAALETSTHAIILTGNQPPSPVVISRAADLGVPMVMVDMDTLTAVERMDQIMGRVRLHGTDKADRIRAMLAEGVRVDDLLAAFGL